jgi:uncharacterized protein (DUF2249 family)
MESARTFDIRGKHLAGWEMKVATLMSVLQAGEFFTLIDDRDPSQWIRPPGGYEMQYLESGPAIWRLLIKKKEGDWEWKIRP